jgi:hypothetical protein
MIIQNTCFNQYYYNFLYSFTVYLYIKLSSTVILEVTSSDPLLQEGEQILPRPLLSYYHPLQVQKSNISKPNLTKPNLSKPNQQKNLQNKDTCRAKNENCVTTVN